MNVFDDLVNSRSAVWCGTYRALIAWAKAVEEENVFCRAGVPGTLLDGRVAATDSARKELEKRFQEHPK